MLRFVRKEPLVHFVILGLVMFWAVSLKNPAQSSYQENTVSVEESKLVRFFQYRSGILDRDAAARQLARMSDERRQSIIGAYVEEEVLFREALALGLDKNDQAVRQRLVQKVKYLLESTVNAGVVPGDEKLKAYYGENQTQYVVKPEITFSHIFFSDKIRGRVEAERDAREALSALSNPSSRASAVDFGDRFIYHRNYVDRTPEEVSSHFGKSLAAAVFAMDPAKAEWQGPVESEYGVHLVSVIRKRAGYAAEFDEVRDQVMADFLFEEKQKNLRIAIGQLVDNYRIDLQYTPAAKVIQLESGR